VLFEILMAAWEWFKAWWWALAIGWILLAAAIGLVVGRVIRNRDRQETEPPSRQQVDKVMQDLSKSQKRG
jgi:flagellar biosynthesis/type III secretory pathway M-ring protein FliF/YscJ